MSIDYMVHSHQATSSRSTKSDDVVSIPTPARASTFARSSPRATSRQDVTATTPSFSSFPRCAAAAGDEPFPAEGFARVPLSSPANCRWQCSHSVGSEPSPLTLGAPHPLHTPCNPGHGACMRGPDTSTVSSSSVLGSRDADPSDTVAESCWTVLPQVTSVGGRLG